MKILHFAELKRGMAGEMRAIADFLEAEVGPADWEQLELYCTFDWLKANGAKVAPLGGKIRDGDAETFINKGINGRWQKCCQPRTAPPVKRALAELGEVRCLAGAALNPAFPLRPGAVPAPAMADHHRLSALCRTAGG